MNQIRRELFTPPTFADDDDKTRVAHTLHFILLTLGAMLFASIPIIVIFATPKLGALMLVVSALTVDGLALILLRNGTVQTAVRLVLGYLWFNSAMIVLLSGGAITVASALFVPIISMTALFLGFRSTAGMIVFTLTYLFVVLTAETAGIAVPHVFIVSDLFAWLVFFASAVLASIPLVFTHQLLLKALCASKDQLAKRQAAEEALRESESRFRLISSMTSDYTFSSKMRDDGVLENVLITGAFEPITGYTRAEFESLGGWRATLHPDDLIQDDLDVLQLRQNRPITSEVRIIRKDGGIAWVRVFGHPVWDKARNQLIGINGAVEDITDRKMAEQTLRESEARFRAQFETAPYMIGVSKIDGTCLDINPEWLTWGSWTKAEVIGKTISQILGVEPAVFAHFNEKMLEDGELNNQEVTVHLKTGEPRTIMFSTRYITYLGEQCILSNAIDVSERKLIEANIRELNRDLRRQTERLSALNEINREIATISTLESALRNIMAKLRSLVPLDACYVTVYDKDTHMIRFPLLYDAGRFWDEPPSPPQEDTLVWKVLEDGKPLMINRSTKEIDMARASGKRIADESRVSASILFAPLIMRTQVVGVFAIHSYQMNAYNDTHRDLIMAVAYQIAIALHNNTLYETLQSELVERKRAEQEVRALNAVLEERVAERTLQHQAALQELQSFTYSVSHDLRAPLRAIDGFSQTLTQNYSAHLPDKAKHYLSRVQVNVQRMGELVDDLLAFVRIGQNQPHRTLVDMNVLVAEVIALFKLTHNLQSIELIIQPLPRVEADPPLIKQVMVNLISNAIKFSSRRAAPRIEIGTIRQGSETVFFVRDNGIGFDMRYVDKLFGVFQRLHDDQEYEGTGIGLATVQRILNAHRGRVWAQSELDQGAVFYFTLPDVIQGETQ